MKLHVVSSFVCVVEPYTEDRTILKFRKRLWSSLIPLFIFFLSNDSNYPIHLAANQSWVFVEIENQEGCTCTLHLRTMHTYWVLEYLTIKVVVFKGKGEWGQIVPWKFSTKRQQSQRTSFRNETNQHKQPLCFFSQPLCAFYQYPIPSCYGRPWSNRTVPLFLSLHFFSFEKRVPQFLITSLPYPHSLHPFAIPPSPFHPHSFHFNF